MTQLKHHSNLYMKLNTSGCIKDGKRLNDIIYRVISHVWYRKIAACKYNTFWKILKHEADQCRNIANYIKTAQNYESIILLIVLFNLFCYIHYFLKRHVDWCVYLRHLFNHVLNSTTVLLNRRNWISLHVHMNLL